MMAHFWPPAVSTDGSFKAHTTCSHSHKHYHSFLYFNCGKGRCFGIFNSGHFWCYGCATRDPIPG